MSITGTSNRKKLRYKPDRLDAAFVMFDCDKSEWVPDEVGIIIDESALAGAQLVLKFSNLIKSGSHAKIKLGHMDPLLAEIVWIKMLAPDVCRVGIKFLE